MPARPLVLHVTADYPDPVREPTTRAVKQLIDGLTGLDHVVVSLKRQHDPRRFYTVDCGRPDGYRLFAHGYPGLPLGVGLFASFFRVARVIRRLLAANDLRPDLVFAHRLSFDGIAGWLLARHYGVPLVVSVRGEVETKIFRFKPTYRPLLKRIAGDAARIYAVSAWFRPALIRMTGVDPARIRPLPNVVANTKATIVPRAPSRGLVSVLNLDIWRKKGLDRLIEAMAVVGGRHPDLTLDVIGGGSEAARAAIAAHIRRHGVGERVRLVGALDNAALIERLPDYLAMVLPSHNETFGMVYTEALFAGVPIGYSRGTGIDGHLDGLEVGVGIDPGSVGAIVAAIERLIGDNGGYRATIAAKGAELAERFDPARLFAMVEADIRAAIATGRG
ncbi:MAG: glycosyltransferase [Hyphomicrobiaceae bacterium]|nr:glycosyltransferase [Hyphomicrobiaceae bacterium]